MSRPITAAELLRRDRETPETIEEALVVTADRDVLKMAKGLRDEFKSTDWEIEGARWVFGDLRVREASLVKTLIAASSAFDYEFGEDMESVGLSPLSYRDTFLKGVKKAFLLTATSNVVASEDLPEVEVGQSYRWDADNHLLRVVEVEGEIVYLQDLSSIQDPEFNARRMLKDTLLHNGTLVLPKD